MELTKCLSLLAVVLPLAYGAPASTTTSMHPELLAAMKRDLGLDAREAEARVALEHEAAGIIDTLQGSTGASFAGAWISEDGATLNVAVTSDDLAEQVTAAGATPVVVANSLSKLEEAKGKLDQLSAGRGKDFAKSDFSSIAGWHVDVVSNKLIVSALADATAQAEALAQQVGLSASEFEVSIVESMPTTFATVRGGDAYYIGGGRCSIGFAVTTGFVSAGHCGRPGDRATTASGAVLGTFSNSVFPGSADMSYIKTVAGTTLSGTVNGYGRGDIPIRGSTAVPRGSSICRSGSTTGVYCGTVSALGATVNYQEGAVTGLTQTNVCAEPGDSGGSWYSGNQAQGVTSGGSGDCRSGGTTFFQPVNEILQTYGLRLVTS